MRESALTEQLDRDGLLADARGAGCYAIRLAVPENFEERWHSQYDVVPDDLFARFAEASEALYVGASGNVYSRLCDHIAGEKRKASILRVCRPERVVDVQPCEEPFDREWSYARGWADAEIAVYCDGEVY